MARPRSIDDDRLLDAADAQLAEAGYDGFTLQSVAARAGVSAATLIKRFGSKHGLLVAIDRRWADGIEASYAELTRRHTDPVERLRAGALWGFDDMDDRSRVTNLITSLAADLADPTLRDLLAVGWGAMREQLRTLAAAAIEAGRLPAAPAADQVARILFALGEGTRLSWAVSPDGSLLRRAEQDVDALLHAWGGDAAQR